MISIVDQKWRMANPAWIKAFKLNPPLDILLGECAKPKILFVHTGKCAGESILRGLRKYYLDIADIYEYHCFDANELIRELLITQNTSSIEDWTFLIANRDPLQRWISSFNWDLHNLFLSKGRALSIGYRAYPTIKDLASSIANKDPEAIKFGKAHHMGMGISWYLQQDLIDRLPLSSTHIIRQEFLQQDFENAITSINTRSAQPNITGIPKLEHTKDDFKSRYPKGTFRAFADLSIAEKEAMCDFLDQDYAVSTYLAKRLHTSQC
jgi:hypothetical protein